jgi:hypothetical protein
MTAIGRTFRALERLKVADFCRSALFIAVIPRETAEFDGDGLADARQ